jgi:GntR family histidine utilization transcriptional repressor
VGTFVASPKTHSALLEIRSIAHEVRDRGGTHSSKVLVLARDRASPKLAVAMGLAPNAEVFHSVLIHLENGQPVQYADRYVNPAVAPDYLKQDFTAMTPSQYLLEVAPVTEAEHIIEAVMPDTRIRKLLEMGINEPCLVVHRRTWTYQLVATKSKFFYPGSRYQLGGRFKPSSGSKLSVA